MKKYNRSNIMKQAWELIRTAGMTIREALKTAWRLAKIDLLVAAGARRWTKANMDRLYINADVIGYQWETRHRTGTIAWATYNDSIISNSEMGRVLNAKTYIDCKDLSLHGTYTITTNRAADWMAAVIG